MTTILLELDLADAESTRDALANVAAMDSAFLGAKSRLPAVLAALDLEIAKARKAGTQ